ncbi:MAG: hypothetical protein HW405_529 [Candidatus Berkelbacteria bacterium]|nr:hypothetical protein [Candidatus Berkelbacteria bacterium]
MPKVLSLSPNLLQIAYINFSNVEENYGYTLYVENKDGNLKKQIYNSSSEIKSPSWDPDSKKIVYSVMTETAGKLKKTTISSKNTQDILSLDNKMIDSCFWQKNGQVVYSDRKIGANNGDIGIIDTDTNKIRNLTSFKGGMANFIYSDDSLNYFGYIVGQYIGEINEKTIGQIFILSSNNQENKALEKGNQILGWSN